MLQADPWTAGDAICHPVVLERDDGAVHRVIAEDQEVKKAGQDHQIENPLVPELPEGALERAVLPDPLRRSSFGMSQLMRFRNHQFPISTDDSPVNTRRESFKRVTDRAPLLIFASYAFGKPMNLEFTIPEVVAVIASIIIVQQICSDGESNWMEGVQLLSVYAILGILFYFLPDAHHAASEAIKSATPMAQH